MSSILKPGERLRPLTSIIQNTSRTDLGPGQRLIPLSENDNLLKEISSSSSGPLQIELAGLPKVQVSRNQFDFIMDHLGSIKDKTEAEAEEIRIASALSFSRNTGLPLEYTLRNLDALTENYLGMEYKPTATAFRAIYNHGQIGRITVKRGRLGKQLMDTTDEGAREQLLQQAAAMDAEMENLQDSLPRNFIVDALKSLGESGYFTTSSAIAGAEGAMIGRMGVELLVKAGLASTNPITGAVAGASIAIPLIANVLQGQNTQEIEAGNLYLDLLNSNVEEPIARHTANIGGYLSMAIEQGLGGLTSEWLGALGVSTGDFTSKLITRMVLSGRLGEIGRFFTALGTGAVAEGLEEGMQGITTNLASDIAYTISQTSDKEPDWNVIENFASDFIGAFSSSLILGAPASAAIAHTDYQTAKALENLSMQVRSKEEYDRLAADLNPDESITDDDWKVITDAQFERGKQEGFNAFRDTISQQDLDTTLVDLDPDAEVQSDDEVTGDGQQKVTVNRLSNGKLYGHESKTRWRLPGSFGSGHTFNYGSPETRKSYGAISYTTDSDGHLTITNVRTRAGYENLRQEMVSDFISRFPDMDITWETNSVEEESIRTNLINSNPRGTDYGLNYGRGTNAADIQNVRTRIGTLFSKDEATNSALAEIVEMVADREGVTGSEWLDRHIPEFRKWTAEEQQEADAGLPEGYHRTGASEFYDLVDGVKAVVYAGEYANPTTFLHEMTHVLRRIGENGNEFRTLFNKVRDDADFQSFVNNSRSIKHKDLSTLFNTDEWTADDDEFFAELGEAYWMSGQTMNNELSGFFSRLTRMFRQIYRALRGTGKLNDEVISYYDRLYGAGTAENRETPTTAPTAGEAVTNASDTSVASEGTEIADTATSVDGTATPTADELRKGANEALDDSADPVVTAEQDPEPATTYTMNASYAVSEWNAAMFRDAFRQKVSNETVRNILDSIPVALHRAAGLVRLSAGSSITPNDQYTLSPRYENMTEEDAAKMQRNADEYAAAVQKHDERQRGIIADGTVALDYTVNGKTYHMDAAAVDGLGMFTPVEYIEEAGLQDNPVRLSINADNVRVEGLEQPDPNVLWKDIPDRTPIMEEDEFADEYDPYESGLDEDGNPLFQTVEDITATGEWQETEARLRANAANFDEAGRPLAPNGVPSRLDYREWVTVRTPSFIRWFGDWMNDPQNASKAVDRNGEPIVVYHGSPNEFTAFDPEMIGTRWLADDMGFFFSSSRSLAEESYADNGGYLYPVFLNLRNPLVANDAWSRRFYGRDVYWSDDDAISLWDSNQQDIINAMQPENDGVIVQGARRYPDMYVALRPEQIKSINNRGTFDRNNPDIYYQTTEYTEALIESVKEVGGEVSADGLIHVYHRTTPENADSIRTQGYMKALENGLFFSTKANGQNIGYGEGIVDFWIPANLLEIDDIFNDEVHLRYPLRSSRSITDIRPFRRGELLYQTQAEKRRIDDEYFAALDRGDMETAQRIVDNQARLNGYISGDDYRMMHQAPSRDEEGYNQNIIDLANSSELVPSDYWTHPERYGIDYEEGGRESFNNVYRSMQWVRDHIANGDSERKIKDVPIVMYRAVPADVKENSFRNGDWITPSRRYAEYHAQSNINGPYRIIRQVVKVGDVYWDANSINEWGYDDGENYAYRNTKNNRKLTDTVVRDFDGNIIPPSQRFNYRKWETFFQTMTDEAQDAYIDAAQTLAVENHEALFQTMDFGDSEELRGYFAQMIKEAANYTDYDEFHAVAEWIYPDDEMVERAWRVAKNPDEGSDNTGAMPKKTLANPDLSASSEDAKDAEFIEIISTDEGFNEWLNAIMQACRDVDSENTRAVYEAVDREEVAPLIRNLVFPRRRWVGVRRGGYDFAARDEKTHAKAIASAKGILRANPSFYRDLYARATETDFWISTYGDRIPQDIIDEAPEEFASLSASGRQKLAERIRNERLRRSILAGSEKYDPSQVRSLIKQQDDAIAAGQLEVKRLEDELNKLGRKYGDAQSARFRLWNQVAEKDAEISAAQQRLTDISNRIAAHSRRDFGDDGSVSQRLVDQQQKLASQISELVKQQNSYLRQLKNDAVSEAVREQYDKDLARMRDIRQKRDEKLQALRDRYKERDALRAVNRHKEELAEIIMREPSKNVDLEEADKIRAIQALLDPAFRRGMRVNGQTWDIDTLKAMFRGETERDPVVFGALTEEQLTRLSKKDLNEWTLEELEEMATAVRALRKQGLQRRQMKVDAERARIQRYRDAAMSTIIGSGNYKEPPTSGSTEKREEDRSFLNRMRSIYYSTINWARKSQILDGTSNHNPDKSRMYNATIGRTTTGHKGVFYDLLVRMKRDAESEEFRMMTERMKPVRDYIKAHKINEDSFYEKFSIDIDGRKQTYRYSDLVYIYLSQNNPRNRDAVAYGEFVSQYEKDTIKRDVEDEIIGAGRKENAARSEEINNRIREIGDARYESVLRQAESIIKDESRRDLFEVVRLIEADFNSGLFDRLRRAMAETYNIRVEKEAYYLPINRTDFAGSEPGEVLKQDLMNMIPDNGSVQRGFTKDRQDISPYWQKPINIDFFNVWQQSVYNQEHALSHIDYVRLLKGIFQNKGSETLQAVISSSYGQTMVSSIKDHINQIANPQSFTKKSGGDSLLRFLRGSLYSSYLGFKASSVVLQAITSPAPYLGAVNPLELAQGYFTVLRNPIQMWEEIQRLSPFMAQRSYHPIIEWMKTEAQRGDLSKVRRTVMRIEDFGMQGLEYVDRYAVAGGWWAIYTKERNRLLNEGNLQTEAEIEKAAAKVADEFVQETQPQSNITELSPMFQNRNEAMAILTQFQASLNVVWQNVTYDVPQAIKNGQYAKAIGMITGYVVAGALLYMVQQGFDDDDDDKEKMQKLLYGMTTQITSGVPLVSDLVDTTVEAAITGETSNFFSSSTFPAFDKLMKAMQNTAKQNYGKAMENLTDSMLLFTGFPYSGLKEAGRLFGIGDEDGRLGFYPGEIVGRRHE